MYNTTCSNITCSNVIIVTNKGSIIYNIILCSSTNKYLRATYINIDVFHKLY